MTAFEDIETDRWQDLGTHRFEAADIVEFARRYDPQPFHLDAEAAKRSVLGGLCASGWHTAAVFMRLNIDHQQREAARLSAAGRAVPVFGPSPGVADLKWTSPVRPGDVVRYRQRVTAKRRSASRPGWGLLTTEVEAVREPDGERVFSMGATVMVRTDEA
ncbi:MaoC family dehydratase [Aureimonas jatrophae]|jgi:acyl dehydratase|uniref:Acyl dehydratase n=1 Tax=Aureimonas jatrophae TaxID=1166073 RepID=A0A1H0ENQ7_9HYPH|nr:MaoC family dehydratase [Aureimonas jatrophae]MBB3950406.1 acyl dehydratase [Aureimonas jatrophae]SDN83959.1 Acyl dehydratase [Aureimonas jatrophae]